jgi:hypothetical protein
MRTPKNAYDKPGFLFVHQAGATDTRGKAERRRISSHVMRNYVARAKDGHDDCRDQAQKPVPQVIQFSLPQTGREQSDFRLPCLVAANTFDPFDSLATADQRNTFGILKTLFEPVQHDMTHFSWTGQWFKTAGQEYWDTAMGDATTYHVVGTLQFIIRRNKDFYFHKVQAYRNLRQSIVRCCQTQAQESACKSTLASIALLLHLASHDSNLGESLHHAQATAQLLTQHNNEDLSPAMWFSVHLEPLHLCTAFPFAFPTVPYYLHPACKWQHLIDDEQSQHSAAQASFVSQLLPSIIVAPAVIDLFRRLFGLVPLATQARHYEAIMGLYIDIKHNLCVCVAEVYWSLPKPPTAMSAQHTPNAYALFTPSRPGVAFFQQMHSLSDKARFEGLQGDAARATYMLLTALHLTLWTLCTNQTRIQANAGAGRLIDSIAEFASEPRCQVIFANHDEALLWIVAAEIAYSRFALRESFADLRLFLFASKLLRKSGVCDVDQLARIMDMFAGSGVWCREALVLVFEDVECIEASIATWS